ncbi:RNA-directed DNA polymerase, eukaryota, partial [Tanacetum coccineum]
MRYRQSRIRCMFDVDVSVSKDPEWRRRWRTDWTDRQWAGLYMYETKMEGFDQTLIRSFWPHPNFNFAFSSAIGASGRILTMWNSDIFNMERKFVDRNFLWVLGHWSGVVPKVGLLNVYAPQLNSQKDSLWEAIESLVNYVEAVWIIFGDFNAVGMPNFGPKPFRIFDKWIGFPEMLDLISTAWASIKGWPPGLLLKNKLKKIRTDIKSWTSNKIVAQKQLKEDLLKNLVDWDLKAEAVVKTPCAPAGDRDDLMQKSRVRWAVKGDENSRFFHYILKNNYANFSINGIHVSGVWSDVPDVIKNGAFEHFSSRFKESQKCRPLFSSPLFRKLSSFDASFLKSSISLEEIKLAVWDCDGTKAPGPDGFNFKFLKAYWDTIKDDFMRCIKYFEET